MFKYRISKYNSKHRDTNGVYLRDEWTSISDVGKVYDDKIFTLSEYEQVENNYLRFVEDILEDSKYTVRKLECYNVDSLADIGLPQAECKRNVNGCRPKSVSKLSVSQAINFIRQCLREKCWGEVKGDSKVIYVGYEFYLHVDSKKEIQNIDEVAEKHCLFVECIE